MMGVSSEEHLHGDTCCRKPLLDVLCVVHTGNVSGGCDTFAFYANCGVWGLSPPTFCW